MNFKDTITGVYGSGASFELREDGKAFRVEGEIPPDLQQAVKQHKDAILAMLTGDPLSGPGWDGRSALYGQALEWMDRKIAEDGLDEAAANRALEADMDRLNAAWCDEDFEGFRTTLREHIGRGLRAARGGEVRQEVRLRA